MIRVLFVCIQNAGRSQMAEAFAKTYGAGWIEAFSAGSKPADAVHPTVAEAMRERDIRLDQCRPKGFARLPAGSFDVVVTMGCGDACPATPAARRIDWSIPDPKGQSIDQVREIRDGIERRVRILLEELRRKSPLTADGSMEQE